MVERLSRQLFNEAKKYIPGGVNSPVRSFKAVGGYPVFIKKARGCRLYSEGNKEFIDHCLSFGALILGHAHPMVIKELKKAISKGLTFGAPTRLETKLAKVIINAIPSIEKIRLTNSGTEAVMTAIRLARAFTRKNKIIKFSGSYHGHADYLLDCEGVPGDFIRHTLVTPYNDIEKLKETVEKYKSDIAAIIVEPVAANMGVVLPKGDFLRELRSISNKHRIILIFDEVITGFRFTFGGAQKLFNLRPDLTCLGKIIGGGLPIGALGGRREIMQLLAPEGSVYQAGTFSGNPVSVSAGLATLRVLAKDNPYQRLQALTRKLCAGLTQIAARYGFKIKINSFGSMFSIFFTDKEVTDYNIARASDKDLFKKFYQDMLSAGIYLSPSCFEADFLSTSHTYKELNAALKAADKTFKNLRRLR